MNWNYYFIIWDREENKSFNALVNGSNDFSHVVGNEIVLASAQKHCYGAIVKRFQNDK